MAQQGFSTNLGLSATPEYDQSKDPALYRELTGIRNALKALQSGLDVYTGAVSEDPAYTPTALPAQFIRVQNISKIYVQATEAISLGQAVNFYDAPGLRARLANATTSATPCMAYCSSSNGVGIGDTGEFVLLGAHPFILSTIPGIYYYLSTTPGGFTSSVPGTAGNIIQELGYGLGNNTLWFNPIIDWTIHP